MRAQNRLLVAVSIAVVLLGGIMAAFAVRSRRLPPIGNRPASVKTQILSSLPAPPRSTDKDGTVETNVIMPDASALSPRPDKLIEEELADMGENPGAIFYMSRIREAMVEGNPAFARELLRQMKELHADSVLVTEAETLLETLPPKKRE